MDNILITGGSGMIGTRLTVLLQEKGYNVAHVSRSKPDKSAVKTFTWDIQKGILEDGAIDFADHIVHLAGANVGAKRWTDERKKVILKSRTASANLLHDQLLNSEKQIKSFISASGISIYGIDNGDKLITENSKYKNDFMANVAKEWEARADKMGEMGIRAVKLRTGVVLSNKGGALKEFIWPVKLGIGSPLGSGKQYMSWIHIDDLCRMYIMAIENVKMNGAYNAVGPNPVTNKVMTEKIAKALHKPLILPKVPGLVIKLMYGEMASLVLGGAKVSNARIVSAGFQYEFTDLDAALRDLLGQK